MGTGHLKFTLPLGRFLMTSPVFHRFHPGTVMEKKCILADNCKVNHQQNSDMHPLKGGLETILKTSKRIGDVIDKTVSSTDGHTYYIHKQCQKAYNKCNTVDQLHGKENQDINMNKRTLRSDSGYDCLIDCIVCGDTIDVEALDRHPERTNLQYSTVVMTYKNGSPILQGTLVSKCKSILKKEPYEKAQTLLSRIQYLGDIRAQEARRFYG